MTAKILFAIFLPNAPDHLLGDLEEEAAATAFLLALPLTVALELRRYALTLIHFRESANFTPVSLITLALITATLAALQLRALPNPRLAVLTATLTTAAIAHITHAPQLLTAATLLGGSLATLQRKRKHP